MMTMEDVLAKFAENDTDVYAYVGPIDRNGYEEICARLSERPTKAKNALLYLCTGGGNPNAGYRIARAMVHHYGADKFRVAVPAECKSAGTLICIGACSLVIFDKGELGPLDVQFQKQDEIFQQSSGLDILRGMTYLQKDALETFNTYLMEINGGSGLSTKVASEIASNLVKGIYEPMYAQIDPIRLGEMNAALQIAHEYGTRLNESSKCLKSGALGKLINAYPTHGFVIDRAEARKLFERVASPEAHEEQAAGVATAMWRNGRQSTPVVLDLVAFLSKIFPPEPQNAEPTEAPADATGTPAPEPDTSAGQPAQNDGAEQPPHGGQ
jgi:hypothetical protein